MFQFKGSSNHSVIKQHAEFLGSTQDKIIHSTEHPCQEATSMDPGHRWYIKMIPKSQEYIKCPKCFPSDKQKNK